MTKDVSNLMMKHNEVKREESKPISKVKEECLSPTP